MLISTFYKFSFLGSILLFVILIGCSDNNQSDKSNSENSTTPNEQATVDSNVLKVYVYQDGKVTADGKEISLSNLDSSFNKLKELMV
jgi:hypothetical protein